MKKYFFVFLAFVALCLFVSTPSCSFAQTVAPTQSIDYALPYPGLLPDNPLYKLKVFRDWVISVLIADPVKKASFDLLQADKRLGASQNLLAEEHPNVTLVIDTLSKAENYFSLAIDQAHLAKQQGVDTTEIVQKMKISNAKHLEIVQQMEQGATGNLLAGLRSQEGRIKDLSKRVSGENPN